MFTFWGGFCELSIRNVEILRNGNGYVIKYFGKIGSKKENQSHFMRQELVFNSIHEQLHFTGETVKTMVQIDNGKLVEETVLNQKIVKTIYELNDDQLLITTSAGNTVSTRLYRRVNFIKQEYYGKNRFSILIMLFFLFFFFLPLLSRQWKEAVGGILAYPFERNLCEKTIHPLINLKLLNNRDEQGV